MKFKATKIATAVAVSLGVSVGGMNVAKADTILFPHFVLSPAVTTLLSVINDDFTALDELHYRYYYNSGSGACQEFNFWNGTSENDVVTFDMGAVFSAADPQGVLFEPSSTTAVYVDDFAALSRQGRRPTRGYVLVDNAPRNPTDPFPAPTARLAGEAIVIDVTSGSAWGYQAYNASDIWGFVPPTGAGDVGELLLINPNDFSDRVEVNGEVLATPPAGVTPIDQKNNFWVPVAIMPWDVVQNAFLVTAVSTNMGTNGGYSVSTTLKLRGTAEGADRIMFNRDERAYSGPGSATVTCVGRVEIDDMVGETVKQATPEGGWSNLTVTAGQAIVFKAEINEAPTVNGVPVNGTFNNIYQLRKGFRETLGRPIVQGASGWTFLPTFAIPELDDNAPYAVWENIFSVPADVSARYNPANYADVQEVEAAIVAGRVFTSSAQ
jgi:hypothetical protein